MFFNVCLDSRPRGHDGVVVFQSDDTNQAVNWYFQANYPHKIRKNIGATANFLKSLPRRHNRLPQKTAPPTPYRARACPPVSLFCKITGCLKNLSGSLFFYNLLNQQ
ncbi:hypothetical protein [Conchiformibius kuhniae]|uniref:Uncharacterized protein n=1 Tax=Conchiformibius kuhniae TaxID=211502 RepID=A0ABD8B7J3_9NEIS|nr:hypothetical protein [Conchiformibius kuhniae]